MWERNIHKRFKTAFHVNVNDIRSADRSVQGTEIAIDGKIVGLFPWHNVSSRVMRLFLLDPTAFRHLDNDARQCDISLAETLRGND